ncbi:EZH inhibitory protein [Cricetulus griseus]|uniref:Uncharacterized protein n=1 Tax=Cricetulus griseus TaxID=10029 RepID=G3I7U3_CRIGR|nr:EZH inhibitory protein [Cricetulus griseus]EGW11288.1 hypothetical protein I79_019592 [Cricetulus griseus]ERE65539.1 hypothetical protein H671_xg20150 [Cricetulus griseus]
MANYLPLEKQKKHRKEQKGVVLGDMKTRNTSESRGYDPVARSGASGKDNALQNLEAEMVASGAISGAGKNVGTFCVPENRSRGPGSPNTELGRVRPWTRSQGEVGQPSKGATSSSGNPAQMESSGSRKQPNRYLATKCPVGPQLLETTESPSASQPPYYLRSRRSEPSRESQKFLGPSVSTATMSHHVSTPASKVSSQVVLPLSGLHRSAPESSSDGSSYTTPAGQDLQQQGTLQVPPDLGLGYRESEFNLDPEGDVLHPGATASGHRSSALEVSPSACHTGAATQRQDHGESRPGSHRHRSPARRVKSDSGLGGLTRENPKRPLKATASSPPRRPVRMRASSPSPPGRLYPFPGQYNEGFRSSSPRSSPVSTLHSPIRSHDQSSSLLSGISDTSPKALWRAMSPDLCNLESSTSGESEEEK